MNARWRPVEASLEGRRRKNGPSLLHTSLSSESNLHIPASSNRHILCSGRHGRYLVFVCFTKCLTTRTRSRSGHERWVNNLVATTRVPHRAYSNIARCYKQNARHTNIHFALHTITLVTHHRHNHSIQQNSWSNLC